MSEITNPETSPEDDAVHNTPTKTGGWRDGELLVLRRNAPFPGRCCAKCGKPAVPPARKYPLIWRPSGFLNELSKTGAIGSFVLIFLLVMGLVSLTVPPISSLLVILLMVCAIMVAMMRSRRKDAEQFSAEFSFCTRHQRLWKLGTHGVTLLLLIGLVLMLVGKQSWPDPLRQLIPLFFVLMLLLPTYLRPSFSAEKIDRKYVYIKGCAEAFLAAFPEFEQEKTRDEDVTETDAETDTFQRPHIEYRFAYNRAAIRKAILICLGAIPLCLIIPAVIPFFQKGKIFLSIDLFMMILPLFVCLLAVLFILLYRRANITLNQEGITCEGFFWSRIPRHCAWKEISRARTTSLPIMAQRQLILMRDMGSPIILSISERGIASFIGVGHSLSLEDAVKQFVGSIEELSEEEKAKMPEYAAFVELGKEVKHVAFLALGVVAIAAAMAFLPNPPLLLDHAIAKPFYWAVFVVVALLACGYMRNIRQKAMMFAPAAILGGVVVFLITPVASRLPTWLGTEEHVVFAISAEDSSEQRWTATTNAEQTFVIHTQPDNRTHKGVGTEQTMLLYRGPGSLNALASQEYRALFIEDPSERNRRGKALEKKGVVPPSTNAGQAEQKVNRT